MINYFDQNPGSFAILRIMLTWVFNDFTIGNTTIMIPTLENDYSFEELGADFCILSSFLRVESQAMMQVVKSTSNYNSLIEFCTELMYANKRTDSPEMIASSKICFSSLMR